jgi:hypothetical protein
VNGERLPVAVCGSALQVSEALASRTNAGVPVVVVTALEDSQFSLDVLARFAGRRLHRIDRWQIVRDLFRARQIDPRLSGQGWIADALLQKVPEGGYPPAASGLLDADTVWTHLSQQHLGLPDGRPDAIALLGWSLVGHNLHRYEALNTEFRAGLRQRIEGTAGATGTAMLDALDAGYGQLLLPIGLVCEILFSSHGRTDLGIAQARARLEPYLAGRMLSSEVGSAWFQSSAAVLATLSDASQREWLDHTQTLLTDLKATEYSALSGVLPSGFNQRLAQFAASAAVATLPVCVHVLAMNDESENALTEDDVPLTWILSRRATGKLDARIDDLMKPWAQGPLDCTQRRISDTGSNPVREILGVLSRK